MNINCYSTSDGHYKDNPDELTACAKAGTYDKPFGRYN